MRVYDFKRGKKTGANIRPSRRRARARVRVVCSLSRTLAYEFFRTFTPAASHRLTSRRHARALKRPSCDHKCEKRRDDRQHGACLSRARWPLKQRRARACASSPPRRVGESPLSTTRRARAPSPTSCTLSASTLKSKLAHINTRRSSKCKIQLKQNKSDAQKDGCSAELACKLRIRRVDAGKKRRFSSSQSQTRANLMISTRRFSFAPIAIVIGIFVVSSVCSQYVARPVVVGRGGYRGGIGYRPGIGIGYGGYGGYGYGYGIGERRDQSASAKRAHFRLSTLLRLGLGCVIFCCWTVGGRADCFFAGGGYYGGYGYGGRRRVGWRSRESPSL